MGEFGERSGGFHGGSRGGRGGGYQGDRDSGHGGGGFRRDFGGPREMHKTTCSSCGKECEVPFKPREGRPVYCRECFATQRSQ
ncbi:DNA-directed RNA polymerase [Candidatus Woesearchaeota archaeon]|nr:DNA-directed RNA polymerase [Candidatus Woesearchaeota archaeon]